MEVALYHGTRRGFTCGGYVFPRSLHGGTGTGAPLKPGCTERADSSEYIYFTTSPELAWAYAWAAPGRGKPKVLTLQVFADDIERDPEHSADMEAYRARGHARVIEVSTEPLMTEDEARSGWVGV